MAFFPVANTNPLTTVSIAHVILYFDSPHYHRVKNVKLFQTCKEISISFFITNL